MIGSECYRVKMKYDPENKEIDLLRPRQITLTELCVADDETDDDDVDAFLGSSTFLTSLSFELDLPPLEDDFSFLSSF